MFAWTYHLAHASIMGQEQIIYDKAALQDNYKEHLSQMRLLAKKLKTDLKTGLPVIDKSSGGLEVSGYQITSLGRLLLRRVGLALED